MVWKWVIAHIILPPSNNTWGISGNGTIGVIQKYADTMRCNPTNPTNNTPSIACTFDVTTSPIISWTIVNGMRQNTREK